MSQSQAELSLLVSGTNLTDGGSDAACRLTVSGNSSAVFHATRVTFFSSTKVECTLGAVPDGRYSLEYSSNGVQYSRAPGSSRIFIQAALIILDVEPPAVLRDSPDQLFLVRVANLRDGAFCLWE